MKVVVSLSGGMDSATLLWLVKQYAERRFMRVLYDGAGLPFPSPHSGRPFEVEAMIFMYGSKHNMLETSLAVQLCESWKVPYRKVNLSDTFASLKSNLLLGGGAVPEGHYADEKMKSTIVPGRNLVFISAMAAYVQSCGGGGVFLGMQAGDIPVYPDCRSAYLSAVQSVLNVAETGVHVCAPFLSFGWDKVGILRWGLNNGVPYHLTRTCYQVNSVACGKCGACVERLEAFQKLGETDPISYEKAV